MSEDGHRLAHYEMPRPRDVRAVCSCGWRSSAFSSPGLAAAAWDDHVAEIAGGD